MIRLTVEGRLAVCDPCYYTDDQTNDLDGLGYVVDDATGTWEIETEVADGGSWGRRVARLTATKVNSYAVGSPTRLADLGVDAGLMAFIPLSEGPVQDWGSFCEDYFKIEDAAGREAPIKVQGRVCSSTGYGDGCYPLFARFDCDGKTAELVVDFYVDNEAEDRDCSGCGYYLDDCRCNDQCDNCGEYNDIGCDCEEDN